MDIIAINGSPRKNGNTATMCEYFLKGTASSGQDVNTTMVHLSEYEFKPCISCFACKKANVPTYGKCLRNDGITDLLQEVSMADGLVFATPVYFGEISGLLRCFLERLLYPYATYEKDFKAIAPKRMPTATIYTMNSTKQQTVDNWHNNRWNHLEGYISRVFMPPQRICAYNTYQFKDYSQYRSDGFSEKQKKEYREKQFPVDCQNAFNAGKDMAEQINIEL